MAAGITGTVRDSLTHEPLIGAEVFIQETNSHVIAGMDGSYKFKILSPGSYTIGCKFFGYVTKIIKADLGNQSLVLNFDLSEQNQKEIIITGQASTGSDLYARNKEKNADNIQNIVSEKSIQLLPDITTGGVLQRVTGITLERTNTGDARYAVIRGMDKRFNYTLVNGVKIPSPDDNFRYVPMDIFPSEMLQRLEVIKSLMPSMEGDAIGGAVNLVMKDAPDSFILTINAGSGLSQLLLDRGYKNYDQSSIDYKSPIDKHGLGYVATPNDFTYSNFDYKSKIPVNSLFGFTIGDRFLKDKRLGVILSGSMQNVYRGSNSLWFQPSNLPHPGNVPGFNDILSRQYNSLQSRYGLQSKIDYSFSPANKISLFMVYVKMNDEQYRRTIDTSLDVGRSGTGTGNTYILWRSKTQDQSIYNATLQGEHDILKGLKLKWSGVYSLATNDVPDWSEYQIVEVAGFDADHNPTLTPPHINIPFHRIWTHNTDRDLAGYLDISYSCQWHGHQIDLATGMLYRDKERNNVYNDWDLIPNQTSTGGFPVFDGHLSGNLFHFNGTSAAQGDIVNPGSYSAYENIFSYYAQAKIALLPDLYVLGGVRVENTEQGWKTVQDPAFAAGAQGYVPYTDILPSVHCKYKISDNQNLRLSWFTAINRPGFFEYVPFTVTGDDWNTRGNPYLQHTTSQNFDIRYELFPKGLDQILVGAFYKTIENPIEEGEVFNGTSSAVLEPLNYGKATNYGSEVTINHFWGRIGIAANATYTFSSITTSKLSYDTDYVTRQTTQTRPLQGQAPLSGNLALQYKDQRHGIDFQLAAVYNGREIAFVSPYKDLDYWQQEYTTLDLSASKKLGKHFSVYLKVNNILNTPVKVIILQPNIYTTGKFALTDQTSKDFVTSEIVHYGVYFNFGARYTL
jgi:TonB-dependent receptor